MSVPLLFFYCVRLARAVRKKPLRRSEVSDGGATPQDHAGFGLGRSEVHWGPIHRNPAHHYSPSNTPHFPMDASSRSWNVITITFSISQFYYFTSSLIYWLHSAQSLNSVLATLVKNKAVPDPFYGLQNEHIIDIADSGRDYYTFWFFTTFNCKLVRLWNCSFTHCMI